MIQLNVVRSIRIIIDALDSTSSAKLSPPASSDRGKLTVPTDILQLKLRLSPLRTVEETLVRRLSPADSDLTEGASHRRLTSHSSTELLVRSTWKESFNRIVSHPKAPDSGNDVDDAASSGDPDDPGRTLATLLDDMKALWTHPFTHKVLESQQLRVRELGGL